MIDGRFTERKVRNKRVLGAVDRAQAVADAIEDLKALIHFPSKDGTILRRWIPVKWLFFSQKSAIFENLPKTL